MWTSVGAEVFGSETLQVPQSHTAAAAVKQTIQTIVLARRSISAYLRSPASRKPYTKHYPRHMTRALFFRQARLLPKFMCSRHSESVVHVGKHLQNWIT